MKTILFYLASFLLFVSLFAGTTGKISGVVKDADTGEPLPGANVVIEGTALGASTDMDGFYSIINIPPGVYTLRVIYIGYADQIIKNVKVEIDLTTQINISLKSTVLSAESVEVIATRPVVQKDISNSQINLEVEKIEALPVTTVKDALSLQAGIESSTTGLIIRGGGPNQVVFMIDGFSTNDERSNYPNTAIAFGNIVEVQVQTGGFNAEYEQARSGIVNVVTAEGDKQKYAGYASLRYRPPAPKHFGNSIYDPYSFFNRPYFDPDVMWDGTDNGAWDEHTRNQYVTFEGWNEVSNATLRDDDPTNDLTPEEAFRLFRWYRRRDGAISKPDYTFDAGFGGPVPFISKYLGDLRFYLSHYNNREMFVFPLSRDAYSENKTQLKFNSNISPSMNLMVSASYGEVASVSAYNWNPPTGTVLRSVEQVADLPSSSVTGMSIPFMPGFFSPTSIYRGSLDMRFTHTISAKTVYEVKFQYKYNNYNTYQTEPRDTTKRYEIFPGYLVDEAPYGYWGYAANGVGDTHLGGWMNLGRDKSKNSTTTFKFELMSQMNKWNQIKTGFSVVYNDFDIYSFTDNPSMSTWRRTMIYHIFPFRIGAFIQDKLEFEGFIANLGLRMDYSDPNGNIYVLDPFSKYYGVGYGNRIDEAPQEKAKASVVLSPRLGIAHPITENSKLYFNYGHFRSEPFSSYRFRLQREYNGQITFMGNPDLLMEKTVAYEIGYEHSLFEAYLFKIAGYYKDVTNQPGWLYYQGLKSDISYYKAANNNYADIRGVEITLQKRYGRWFSGFINYTYDVRTSGYFGILEFYEDPKLQREYLREHPVMIRQHPLPYARANLEFHTPKEYGYNFKGFYPFGDWRLNILANWKTGRYYTYNPYGIPGVVDDTQWKDWYNVDLKLTKSFKLAMFDVSLYMDIRNVFNFKYMSRAGFSDSYDWQDYLESLNFPWESGDEKGNDRIGEYRPPGVEYDPLEPNPNNDPDIRARNEERKKNKSYIDMPNIKSLTFLNPRNILFGITIRF